MPGTCKLWDVSTQKVLHTYGVANGKEALSALMPPPAVGEAILMAAVVPTDAKVRCGAEHVGLFASTHTSNCMCVCSQSGEGSGLEGCLLAAACEDGLVRAYDFRTNKEVDRACPLSSALCVADISGWAMVCCSRIG